MWRVRSILKFNMAENVEITDFESECTERLKCLVKNNSEDFIDGMVEIIDFIEGKFDLNNNFMYKFYMIVHQIKIMRKERGVL